MFGFSAFADAPFASLTTNPYNIVAEPITLSDGYAVMCICNTEVSAPITLFDSFTSVAVYTVGLSDTLPLMDAYTPIMYVSVAQNEVIALSDGFSAAGSTYNVSNTNSIALLDGYTFRFLWEPIDDVQSANWVPVITYQE